MTIWVKDPNLKFRKLYPYAWKLLSITLRCDHLYHPEIQKKSFEVRFYVFIPQTFEKCCNVLKAEYSITRSHNIRERRIIPSRIQQKRYYYYISCIRNNKFMQHSTWYIMLVVKMMILVLNSNLTSPTNTMKKMNTRWWEEEKNR